ncbi:MAG: MarR family winged helix-turn-helix transcriptional regulator [Phycisphaerales bacterium JB037]
MPPAQPSGLASQVGKRRPFDSPEQEAHLNILRTACVLEGSLAPIFKDADLSPSSYNVLRILRGAGPEGRRATEIGCDMVVRVPDVTRLVDRLIEQGLAERRRCDEDRRVVFVRITRKGSQLLHRLDAPVLEAHKAQLGHLTRKELAELNRLLVKARNEPEPPG